MSRDINAATFNEESNAYNFSRPHYPIEIFKFLSEISPGIDSAWDCACGTGQASKYLSKYFSNIQASDISENQIKFAYKHENIIYSVQDSEKTTYPSNSFDLVCVAQALHWFSSPAFFKEIRRVLKDKGIFACWGYSFFKISPSIDLIVDELIFKPLKTYWSRKNKILWNGYSDIKFPFTKIPVPYVEMSQEWTKIELVNYIKTWSAYKRFSVDNDTDILSNFLKKITDHWTDGSKMKVIMDFVFYCGQK